MSGKVSVGRGDGSPLWPDLVSPGCGMGEGGRSRLEGTPLAFST